MSNDLNDLKSKLKDFKSQHKHLDKKQFSKEYPDDHSWKKYAFQLSSELLAGLLVGMIIGYTIDYFFNTKPWGLISLMFLGGIAGIYNVCRNLLK